MLTLYTDVLHYFLKNCYYYYLGDMLGGRFLQSMWLCWIATRFIFETEKHNGIAELLEILGRLVYCVIMVISTVQCQINFLCVYDDYCCVCYRNKLTRLFS